MHDQRSLSMMCRHADDAPAQINKERLMKRLETVIWIGLAAALSTAPAVSFGGKCSGTNINNMVSWEPTEINKGTTLATLRITSVTVNDDRTAPNHLVSGECIGSFITKPDGKTDGRVFCARKDKDGDVLNEEAVTVDGNASKGTWKNVGGTGKFANATGSAQWEVLPLQGKMAAVRWVGDCQW